MCNEQNAHEKLRILAIVAHPHDFTHCSGTCGVHVRLGDEVTVVTLMNGRKMHNEKYYDELKKPVCEQNPDIVNMSLEEYGKQKEQEFIKGVELFGITDIRILHAPEPFRFFKSPEYAEEVAKIILDVRPDIVITQSPYIDENDFQRNHMANLVLDDHSQVAIAVHEGLYIASVPNHETKVVPHRVAMVIYMGVYFNRDRVDFYVDISDFVEQRIMAEAMFDSQGHTYEYAKKSIERTVGGQGSMSRMAYSEGFVRSTFEVCEKIPISPLSLRRAKESALAALKRIEG